MASEEIIRAVTLQVAAVDCPGDLAGIREVLRRAAAVCGFDMPSCDDLGLVGVDLAGYVLKWSGGGRVIVSRLGGVRGPGIQVVAKAHKSDQASAIQPSDGDCHSPCGRAAGLGKVKRMADDLQVKMVSGRPSVRYRKWVRRQTQFASPAVSVTFGVATRARERVNGDEFVIRECGQRSLVGVIDGCGHGEPAHLAARTARRYVEKHCDQPLEEIFVEVERACRRTRGVVMALARFDWTRSELSYAAVGNIEARYLRGGRGGGLPLRRGLLGAHAPSPLCVVRPWTPADILAIHSDGVSAQWDNSAVGPLLGQSAEAIAVGILRGYGKTLDDATVLVVRGGEP